MYKSLKAKRQTDLLNYSLQIQNSVLEYTKFTRSLLRIKSPHTAQVAMLIPKCKDHTFVSISLHFHNIIQVHYCQKHRNVLSVCCSSVNCGLMLIAFQNTHYYYSLNCR